MLTYLKLLRVHQYVKNGFILLPLFFAVRFTELDVLLNTLLAAGGFCFVASSIYILNDILDRNEDRNHPTKKDRPIASGAVSVNVAIGVMVVLLILGLSIVSLASIYSLYFTLGYLGMNILYTLKLKHIPILDINLIAIGFVLRLYIGGMAGEVELSSWIILMTFLLALFLALAKRRDDVLLAIEGREVRKSIDGYNLEFINGGMIIMASVTIVAYISYCLSKEIIQKFDSEQLYLTVVFVIMGVLRYLQITFVLQKSGSPTKVLIRDVFLQLTIIGWVAAFILLIYMGKL